MVSESVALQVSSKWLTHHLQLILFYWNDLYGAHLKQLWAIHNNNKTSKQTIKQTNNHKSSKNNITESAPTEDWEPGLGQLLLVFMWFLKINTNLMAWKQSSKIKSSTIQFVYWLQSGLDLREGICKTTVFLKWFPAYCIFKMVRAKPSILVFLFKVYL